MPDSTAPRSFREAIFANKYECLALLLCLLLGLAMIVNTQLGGEGMWFWYATLFNQGAKLYSGLHTALQPFLCWKRQHG